MNDGRDTIRRLLSGAKTIAVVGMSAKPERDSHIVGLYLADRGYRVIPVNPTCDQIASMPCYPSISAVPPDIRIDIVDIFRHPDAVPPIVDEAIERGVDAVWMQLGIRNAEEAARAREADLTVVEDRCIKKEHEALFP